MLILFHCRVLSQAYHRYALNYINALNYLETLRRQQEFCDFEKVTRCFTTVTFNLKEKPLIMSSMVIDHKH